jgi:hypothetical protein
LLTRAVPSDLTRSDLVAATGMKVLVENR